MLKLYIGKHRAWSMKTFGAGYRTVGLIKHIQSELKEIEENPMELDEWVDVMILAIDGAWRAGYSPNQIVKALKKKQKVNFARKWPEGIDENSPVLHIKEE